MGLEPAPFVLSSFTPSLKSFYTRAGRTGIRHSAYRLDCIPGSSICRGGNDAAPAAYVASCLFALVSLSAWEEVWTTLDGSPWRAVTMSPTTPQPCHHRDPRFFRPAIGAVRQTPCSSSGVHAWGMHDESGTRSGFSIHQGEIFCKAVSLKSIRRVPIILESAESHHHDP